MIVKDVHFNSEGRAKLMSGIDKIADAVKSTLGARGNTVLIESENHTGGMTVTKDGVTVARSLFLIDPTENLAVQMMKQAASNTATTAGDGTTTAIVLTQAMIHAAADHIGEGVNETEVYRHMQAMSKDVISRLKRRAKKVTDKNLLNVATISANSDKEIGQIIYDAYKEVGDTGVVTVENSRSTHTTCEITHGMKVDRGFVSRYFINDERSQQCVLEKPYIFLSDQEITSLGAYEEMLKPIIQSGRSILFISNMSSSVLSTLTVNKVKGTIKVGAIIPPSFGYRTDDLMQDIAIVTGGRYLSEKMGTDATLANITDLGVADKAVISQSSTVLVAGADNDEVKQRIADVKAQMDEEKGEEEKKFLEERLALLSGGVAVIYVGAQSDIEQKEKKDRVDDAVCATKAALESGILPGGGIALLEEAKALHERVASKNWTKEEVIAKDILGAGMRAPFEQINRNGGFIPSEIINHDYFGKRGHGFDVKREQYGSMIAMGIIDPCKVTVTALENAVSVATTILSTNAIITNVREQA